MRTALIVGAGIGGLAAGIALRRAGWRTRIFERAAAPRELGFALNLAPNAVLALRALGVSSRVEAEGNPTTRGELRRLDGRTLKRFDATGVSTEAPAFVALRQTVHGALLDATPAEDLTLGSAGTAFDEAGGELGVGTRELGVDAKGAVVLRLADGSEARGDVLVGADGLGSAIRRQLHPDEPAPRDSGLYAIRGVARGVAGELGEYSGAAYLGPGVEAATVRASVDAIYWFVSVKAATLPPGARDAATMAPRLLARMPPAFRRIAEASDPADLRADVLVDRDPIAPWGRGPVTLLGDAAHPMLPQTGQGAAQALEDAVALGEALREPPSIEAGLRAYEQVRARRTAALQRRGRRMASALKVDSIAVDWLRAGVIRLMPSRVLVAAMLKV
jgi:2-polyprenyl-6-methoxyphenol hydroxylase-like FAD-dependent oxidoreductase